MQNANFPNLAASLQLPVSTQQPITSKSPPFFWLINLFTNGVDSRITYFSKVCNSLLCLIILVLKYLQIWPVGVPSSWFLVICSRHFEHFFIFLYYMFQAHLVLTLPQSWSQSFLQGSWIPLNGKWDLNT